MLRRFKQSQVQYNDCETIKLCGRKMQTHLQGVFGGNEIARCMCGHTRLDNIKNCH